MTNVRVNRRLTSRERISFSWSFGFRHSFVICHSTFLILWLTGTAFCEEPTLLLALATYREQPKQPQILFYEHDGVASGKMLEGIPHKQLRSDNHPILSHDGRFCVYATEQENETSRIALWDRQEKKLVDLPMINDSPNAQLWPTLSGDGRTIVFAAWNRPNSSQRWDLFTYDVAARHNSPLPEVNTSSNDERMPALSGDGRRLALVTNAKENVGVSDIAVCDLTTGRMVALPGLNSEHREVEPSLSNDGRFIAFVSDRPGGAGGRDIHLYDCETARLVDLPGLNSVAHEQTPSLSPSGRYLAFVSERIRGEGERDVFLYDIQRRELLPTPGLNARGEDIDPCVIELSK